MVPFHRKMHTALQIFLDISTKPSDVFIILYATKWAALHHSSTIIAKASLLFGYSIYSAGSVHQLKNEYHHRRHDCRCRLCHHHFQWYIGEKSCHGKHIKICRSYHELRSAWFTRAYLCWCASAMHPCKGKSHWRPHKIHNTVSGVISSSYPNKTDFISKRDEVHLRTLLDWRVQLVRASSEDCLWNKQQK